MANAEKRSVSTDALETLGTIIDQTAGRDAVHIAVEPLIAAHSLRPGDHVGILPNGLAGYCEKALGIVDPFLKTTVDAGKSFWLLLYPRQITSLRHVWSHPAFTEDPVPTVRRIVASERDSDVLADGAGAKGVSLDDLMKAIDEYLTERESGGQSSSICFGDDIEYGELPLDFWDAYERVTGRKVPQEFRNVYFRCAC